MTHATQMTMPTNPSETLHRRVSEALIKAFTKSLDWEVIESMLEPSLDYVQSLLEVTESHPSGPFCFSFEDNNHDGLTLSLDVADNDGPTFLFTTETVSLLSILHDQWGGCFRSQAKIVWGLERTLSRLKEEYKDEFGIDCTPEAVAGEAKRLGFKEE
jgi:hypothetical protein